jgi:hypothetical protein
MDCLSFRKDPKQLPLLERPVRQDPPFFTALKQYSLNACKAFQWLVEVRFLTLIIVLPGRQTATGTKTWSVGNVVPRDAPFQVQEIPNLCGAFSSIPLAEDEKLLRCSIIF